ncbi:uncharacterized protein LOC113332418 [Papaver somniferum]|uniref:uncharacterized protein LOC113332418 n=1 Tax=Papaver somniferum TaxID=3469 RepID=UPI000E701A2B|nr:uncharacterized protein LOC113332418 [Papaver somniferum]
MTIKDVNDKVEANTAAIAKLQANFTTFSADLNSQFDLLLQKFDSIPEPASTSRTEPQGDNRFHYPHHQPYQHYRLPKLDFPRFDGENPRAWIQKSERYFELNDIEEHKQVNIAAIYLEDLASHLCARFENPVEENFVGSFNKLVQSSSVDDYYEEFEMLKTLMLKMNPTLSEEYFVMSFLSGLKDEIGKTICMFHPKTLVDVFSLARLQEKKIALAPAATKPFTRSFNTSFNSNRQCTSGNFPPKPIVTSPKSAPLTPKSYHNPTTKIISPTTTIKRLTPEEMNRRRSQGLCYKCDEVYKTRHFCKGKQKIFMLQMDTADSPENEEDEEVFEETIESPVQSDVEISLHALTGTTNGDTIRIPGILQDKTVSILIDSGSTTIFIDSALASSLQYHIESTVPMVVTIANGEKTSSTGICPQEPTQLPPQRNLDHKIPLQPNLVHVNQRSYKCPYIQKDIVEQLVKEMLHSGIIQPSHIPFSSSILLVKKKDNTWRFCVDYRKLNNITAKDKFPIPIIEELLDELNGATAFTRIDLRAGYHQIIVHLSDIFKTSFRTHQVHYEFKVMPFGLTNAPATFQSLMNEVFQPALRKFILVFFDYILIYSKNMSEHVEHLKYTFSLLRQHKLYAKMTKCCFGQSSLEYLGHIITAAGVCADPSKIACMQSWPTPSTLKELGGFLGLTYYYRKFVKNYGEISKPLIDLLKKNSFLWTSAATTAFENLKTAMSNTLVLALPNFTKPFIVESDASDACIGAILIQEGRPIAYFSKPLGPRVAAMSTYEK